MEAAAVRLSFLFRTKLQLSYNVMYIAYNLDDVNSCTRNKINFSKDNNSLGLCTLVPFIIGCFDIYSYKDCVATATLNAKRIVRSSVYTVACYSHCVGWEVYIIQDETDKRYIYL